MILQYQYAGGCFQYEIITKNDLLRCYQNFSEVSAYFLACSLLLSPQQQYSKARKSAGLQQK